jgi:malate dehydrogenase (quinone)
MTGLISRDLFPRNVFPFLLRRSGKPGPVKQPNFLADPSGLLRKRGFVKKADVLLVGAGIMSATLGTLLKELDPSLKIVMVERLSEVAKESSDGWNNAGTGHAGYCELNYTPQDASGNVTVDRAIDINASFEKTLQFWSTLVERGTLPPPQTFINRTPHLAFVWGREDVEFLRQRTEKMRIHPLFNDMEFSDDPRILAQWMPLVMHQRDGSQPVAASRLTYGSDVDFGALNRSLVKSLNAGEGFELLLGHQVVRLRQKRDGRWKVKIKNRISGEKSTYIVKFLFLGAGGGALPLLKKSGIPEGRGYGGFPVSGQWLVCLKPEIVAEHHAKVYGKAAIGAPPMSVPHLDTRIIDGKPALLFGPFAGFTTKFLKEGSVLDLFKSLKTDNLMPLMGAGMYNMALTKYLIKEVFQSHKKRMVELRKFFPKAKDEDWSLAIAGQRVQIIKKGPDGRGKLEFGTELVSSADGSIAALLGASPGASVAVKAMIEVLEKCFPQKMAGEWKIRLKEMIPSYGESLRNNPDLLKRIRERNLTLLNLR